MLEGDAVRVPVCDAESDPVELAVGEPLGVFEGLVPPDDVPVCVAVMVAVGDAVGVCESLPVGREDGEAVRVVVAEGVTVAVGVAGGVPDALELPESETVGVIELLAPGVTAGVEVEESDAGFVFDPEPVPEVVFVGV